MSCFYVNKKLRSNNTSGYTGVHLEQRSKRWIATIKVEGKRFYIGSYQDKMDAVFARTKVAHSLDVMQRLCVSSISMCTVGTTKSLSGIMPENGASIHIVNRLE